MNCPLCVDQALEPNFRAGIEIDVCPTCKGIWLDRGEIDKLVADAPPTVDIPSSPAALASAGPAPAGFETTSKSKGSKGKGAEGKGKSKKKRKKSLAELLGDALEEVLD